MPTNTQKQTQAAPSHKSVLDQFFEDRLHKLLAEDLREQIANIAEQIVAVVYEKRQNDPQFEHDRLRICRAVELGLDPSLERGNQSKYEQALTVDVNALIKSMNRGFVALAVEEARSRLANE